MRARSLTSFIRFALIAVIVAALGRLAPCSAADAVQLARADRAFENPDSAPGKSILSADDEKFLDDLEQRGIAYFTECADPVTGLMPDRAGANGGAKDVASIASVGFGLTALCIGDERGWIKHQEAYDRALRVLRFLREKAP